MTALWVWLALAAICVVIEVLTLDLIFFNLGLGSLAGAGADLAGVSTPFQIVVAAVVALLGLLLLRPVALRHLRKQTHGHATNVDALPGQLCRVNETVSETTGLATVRGEQWSARTAPGESPLPANSTALIQRVDGAYLILQSAPSAEPPTP